MQTADVVIIGGGIVGSSIAWHLTEAGCRNVLMVERESHQGKGSTGKSMGGVRAQFATAPNIQMSLYSIPFYAAFEERLGHPSGYRDQGYLFVATKPSHLEYLQTNQALQKIAGADAGSHDDARGDCRDRAATARRRRAGRQLLSDRWLRRSLQRDGRLHHARLRAGRDVVALDRGHGDSSQRNGHHRRGNHARAGEHARRRQRCGRVGGRGRPRWRESSFRWNRCGAC